MQKSNNELAEGALAVHVGQHLVDFVSPQINDANTFLVYLPNLERFPASGCDLIKDISCFFFPIYSFSLILRVTIMCGNGEKIFH